MEDYVTLAAQGQDEYTVSRSRFIGYARPVETPAAAAAFVEEIRAMHREARHNVYAYTLRAPAYTRFSDDGEPQGTAGKPVLEVLRQSGVTNCCVVVTRYFGGVLLGAGGLVRAYAHTAKLALAAAGTVVMKPCRTLVIRADYALYGSLSALIPRFGGVTLGSEFGERVELAFRLPLESVPGFEKALSELTNGGVSAAVLAEGYAAF